MKLCAKLLRDDGELVDVPITGAAQDVGMLIRVHLPETEFADARVVPLLIPWAAVRAALPTVVAECSPKMAAAAR